MATRAWTNNAAPYLEAATLAAMELDIAAGGKPLTGAGIDITGATVSTTAVQAFLNACTDGDTVVVPTGAIINLDAGLTISKRIRFTGSGELRWTAGVIGAQALTITADGTHFDGLRLNNSLGTANQTGGKQYGIAIAANFVKVTGCTTLKFQQAIAVLPTGEWHDFVIANNIIIDVPGSGDGPSNASSNGEDRGDGIVSWGAAGVITGNRVSALAGTDARLGIHVEGLPTFETVAPGYIHADSMVAITGNTVTGQFRRSIVAETVARVTIVGNTVADATWWGIAIIGIAARCVVANNTVKWTRTSTDNQGSAWSPVRSGIMLYKTAAHARVIGNVIYAETGATMTNGITAQAPDSGNLPTSISITDNTIDAADANISTGISIPNGGTGVEVAGNRVAGFTSAGILSFAGVTDFHARGNLLYGSAAAAGIRVEGAVASGARVDDNTIHGCTVGINLFRRTLYATAIGNVIYSATTGIDLFQSTAPVTVSDNTFVSVTTKIANLPTGAVSSGNN